MNGIKRFLRLGLLGIARERDYRLGHLRLPPARLRHLPLGRILLSAAHFRSALISVQLGPTP